MTTLIIGAGQAGQQTAESLRAGGYESPIILASDEPHLPYQLPPLSKGYLKGTTDRERLAYRSEEFYQDRAIDLRLSSSVTTLDLTAKTASLGTGEEIAFEHLVFATGSRPVVPPIPGVESERVCYMRTLDDADRFADLVTRYERFAVVGAGFIGLEAAASLRHFDKEVTVIEAAERVMARVVSPEVSAFFETRHRTEGVKLLTGALCKSIEDIGDALIVTLSSGEQLTVDCLLMGVGAVPNSELAEAAGVATDRGILVDGHQSTNIDGVFAAGDCCVQHNAFWGGQLRLESVQNAIDQGKVIAANILGKSVENAAVPWFWSDQFDLKYQMAGLAKPEDSRAIIGDATSAPYSIAHFRNGALAAVESVNQPGEHMAARRLLERAEPVTQAQLDDAGGDLRALFKALR